MNLLSAFNLVVKFYRMRHAFLPIATWMLACLLTPWQLIAQNPDFLSIFGTKTIVSVHSTGLEGNLLGDSPERPVTVYLPPGYETSPENRYPVIYFLHGILCDHLTFFGAYNPEQDFQVILDRMFNTRALPPVILVSPNSYNAYMGSFYTNPFVTGQWEDFIVKDLIDYMDENYRTIPTRESRGICGHSMGGYGAMKLAMDHPSLFNATYGLSPYGLILEDFIFDIAFEDIKEATVASSMSQLSVNGQSMVMQAAAFAPDSSGQPFMGQFPLTESGETVDTVLQKWLKYDPYTMLESNIDSLLKYKAIQYDCGTEDQYGFYPVCLAFSDILDKYEFRKELRTN